MAAPTPPNLLNRDALNLLSKFFESYPSVSFVKCFWVSINGFTYCRVLTKCRSLKAAEDSTPLRVHVSGAGGFVPSSRIDTTFVSSIGRICIWPIWSSLRVINSAHAAVQCKVAEDLSLYKSLCMPTEFQRCPSSCLERVVNYAKDRHSLVFLAAFEIEFYLFEAESGQDVSSVGQLRTWSSAAFMRGRHAECVEQCMLALEEADLVVEQGHAESSPNQFEISIGPLPVVAAAHAILFAREIIKSTAEKHGIHATFLPKPFAGSQATGLHLHLSVHQHILNSSEPSVRQMTLVSTRSEYEVSREISDAFLSGILERLRLLFALSMPSEESYARNSNGEAMGNYVSWGKNNSSVPLSEVATGYWEIRSLDWTANIYLALAAYLSAGLLGVREKQSLQHQDPHALTSKLDPEALQRVGISEFLPKSLDEALECLIAKKYGSLQDIIGEEILDLFIVVKSAEVEYMRTIGVENRRTLFMYHI